MGESTFAKNRQAPVNFLVNAKRKSINAHQQKRKLLLSRWTFSEGVGGLGEGESFCQLF